MAFRGLELRYQLIKELRKEVFYLVNSPFYNIRIGIFLLSDYLVFNIAYLLLTGFLVRWRYIKHIYQFLLFLSVFISVIRTIINGFIYQALFWRLFNFLILYRFRIYVSIKWSLTDLRMLWPGNEIQNELIALGSLIRITSRTNNNRPPNKVLIYCSRLIESAS